MFSCCFIRAIRFSNLGKHSNHDWNRIFEVILSSENVSKKLLVIHVTITFTYVSI